jgi:tripartite-type tricarboxylate transporter receptor subunit TctC
MMFRLTQTVFVACALIAPVTVGAQSYPSKSVRLILPVPPGGVGDLVARQLAQRLSQHWGQQVLIDNRAGATGLIGLGLAAKAPPDGYTLLWGSSNNMSMNPALLGKPSPAKDYAAITPVVTFPNILVVHPSLPVQSVRELIALARKHPQQLRFASAGNGSTNHLSAEVLQSQAGIKITHVPYKGGGPALTDLLGGHIEALFATSPSAMTHIKAGKLKPLMVTSATRLTALPAIPSAKDAGVPDLLVSTWNGIFAPAATAGSITSTLHAAISAALGNPEMAERIVAQAAEVYLLAPDHFAAMIGQEHAYWSGVVKKLNLTME